MEVKFARDPPFYALYADFMRQYAELGHMTPALPLTGATPPVQACFLPHHGVMRDSSSTTKLRVVFNGSTAVAGGKTLNRCLMTGPNLLPALSDILLRWRRHRFVLATDIEMFRQIEVHAQDRNLQRILWREGPNKEIQEYQLNTVTYGLSCAPYLAIRTLHQLAEDEANNLPLGAAVLRKDTYMDDILTGAPSIPEAKDIKRELVQICTAGGFPLKKWSANDASLLEDLPKEDHLQRESRWWEPGESHSTLGLCWHPHDNSFAFATQLPRVKVVSKREVLALTARLFDHLGWLAPTTVRADTLPSDVAARH